MFRLSACALLVAALAACSDPASPVAPDLTPTFGKAPASFSVTSTLGSGSITGDGVGSYANGGGVVSIIQGGLGAWELDQGTARKTSLTLGSATTVFDATRAAQVTTGAQLVSARFLGNPGTGWRYDTMSPSDVGVGTLSIAFTAGGRQYGLRMNNANRTGSDNVRVECTAGTTGRCTSWTITPLDGVSATAHLEEVLRKGFANVGLYEVSFSITVTRP